MVTQNYACEGNSTNAPCGEPVLFNCMLQLIDRVKMLWGNGSATDTEFEIEPFDIVQITERFKNSAVQK